VEEAERQQGVLSVKEVKLGHANSKESVHSRLIHFYDEHKDRYLTFITNDRDMPGSQIAEIYKQRWQIELLFKRLKQNLQLSDFLGDNENAVRIQIWCNLIADLLLTVLRKGAKLKRAYSNIAGLVRLHLMNYVDVNELLNNPGDIRIFENNQNEYNPESDSPPPSLI
jgi:transposase